MAYADGVITWVPATDATSTTDYEVWSDAVTPNSFELVTTRDATLNPGGSVYTAVSTTLAADITATATTVTFASYTNLAAGDTVRIGTEPVYLGSGTGPFDDCVRGYGDGIAVAHTSGDVVLLAHETYTYTAPYLEDNAGRHLIRVEIRRRQGLDYSIMEQTLLVYPTPPANTVLCTVYGVETDGADNPLAGMAVAYELVSADTYLARTGENIVKRTLSTTTDASGYWEFQLHKSAYVVGSVAATITATDTNAPDSTKPKSTYNIVTVPDQNFAHVRECLA